MELKLILMLFAGEALLVVLAVAAFKLFRRRPKAAPAALELPDELAQEARRYLQAELEKTERRLEETPEHEKAPLAARARALSCELRVIELAENPDAFWAGITEGYGPTASPAPTAPAEADPG